MSAVAPGCWPRRRARWTGIRRQRTGSTARVENDANLGALGEYTFGAGRGKQHQIYLKLGRHSVGTGLIFGGRLHRGIGRPLADACTLLNPDLFVLDGSIGPAGDHIFNGITAAIERYAAPAISAAARVVRGELGTNTEVLGAVVLIRQERERAAGIVSGSVAPR